MTDIIIRKNSDGDICGFEMDGHAGFAEYGQDIVCAALSMLSINTINSIAEQGQIDNTQEVELTSFESRIEDYANIIVERLCKCDCLCSKLI